MPNRRAPDSDPSPTSATDPAPAAWSVTSGVATPEAETSPDLSAIFTPTTAPTAKPRRPQAAPAGVPPTWAGLSGLLQGSPQRGPQEALTLVIPTASTAGQQAGADLAGLWPMPETPAEVTSRFLLHRLDGTGRLVLPMVVEESAYLPAERDGAVVTVFLPGSPSSPRRGYAIRAVLLDVKSRLTFTQAIRTEVQLPPRALVLACIDHTAGTVTVIAANRVHTQLLAAIDAHRRPHTL